MKTKKEKEGREGISKEEKQSRKHMMWGNNIENQIWRKREKEHVKEIKGTVIKLKCIFSNKTYLTFDK